jgi:hypothetical protein
MEYTLSGRMGNQSCKMTKQVMFFSLIEAAQKQVAIMDSFIDHSEI